jgi:hypothetical protein
MRRVDHLLRVRVLQELELLAQRLQTRPRHVHDHPVIRRLTRAEWKAIKETHIIPFENAVAVVVVPPLNKNPKTKQRPAPSASSGPIEDEERALPDKPLPPVSTLYYVAPRPAGVPIDVAVKTHQFLPDARVPLYNGISVFPSRVQRAALHKALNTILAIERKARRRGTHPSSSRCESLQDGAEEDNAGARARGDQKASHAYVVFSDSETLLRADTVPLAIALWRIRMWEGQGWESKSKHTSAGGWKIIVPKPLPS